MPLKMSNLEKCFKTAHEKRAKFVAITVEMDGFPKHELIVNKYENILPKLEYYKSTYDENLQHKYSKNIRIFGFSYGDSLAELQDVY